MQRQHTKGLIETDRRLLSNQLENYMMEVYDEHYDYLPTWRDQQEKISMGR